MRCHVCVCVHSQERESKSCCSSLPRRLSRLLILFLAARQVISVGIECVAVAYTHNNFPCTGRTDFESPVRCAIHSSDLLQIREKRAGVTSRSTSRPCRLLGVNFLGIALLFGNNLAGAATWRNFGCGPAAAASVKAHRWIIAEKKCYYARTFGFFNVLDGCDARKKQENFVFAHAQCFV